MTIPFRPVPPVASWVATHKEAEMVRHPKTLIEFMELYSTEEDWPRPVKWCTSKTVGSSSLA